MAKKVMVVSSTDATIPATPDSVQALTTTSNVRPLFSTDPEKNPPATKSSSADGNIAKITAIWEAVSETLISTQS